MGTNEKVTDPDVISTHRLDVRPIKFRAWDMVGKRMISELICFYPPNCMENSNSHWGISHSNEFNKKYMWGIEDLVPLEFTGYYDKNNKEIYDGDVICSEFNRAKNYNLVRRDCEYKNFYVSWYDNPIIIGNAYENPELLTCI